MQKEAEAATLSSLYYGVFTCTRILAAPVSWCGVSARATLAVCLVLGLGSISTLWLAISYKSVVLLKVFCGVFGFFSGPMWPAMQSILTEDYGFELDTIHMAVVLCCAKIGIFASNILFSWELSADVQRSHNFPITFVGECDNSVLPPSPPFRRVCPRTPDVAPTRRGCWRRGRASASLTCASLMTSSLPGFLGLALLSFVWTVCIALPGRKGWKRRTRNRL